MLLRVPEPAASINEADDAAIFAALSSHGIRPSAGSFRHGWTRRSVGFKTASGSWCKIAPLGRGEKGKRVAAGPRSVNLLLANVKPRLRREFVLPARDAPLLVQEFDCAIGRVTGSAAHIARMDPSPQPNFWQSIESTLSELREIKTERQSVRGEYLARRISSISGIAIDHDLNPVWEVGHGDLHWGNVTTAGEILDWDTWGRVPEGYDAATLWVHSLNFPRLAARFLNLARNRGVDRNTLACSQALACSELLSRANSSRLFPAPYRASVKRLLLKLTILMDRQP